MDTPKIMGILNITQDSFYDGNSHNSIKKAILKCSQMIVEGADIIDIGAVSSRPGAEIVSASEEESRLLPIFKEIRKEFPEIILSVDTYNSEVVKIACEEGIDMVNDISGGLFDDKMLDTVASTGLPYILMHIQGDPRTMQLNPVYTDVTSEVRDHLFSRADLAKEAGINQVILDPGFGFGKTPDHNFRILKHLRLFGKEGHPVLAGISRKSMINKVLETGPEAALNGTTVLNTIALLNGADILRVHDVKEAMEAVKLVEKYYSG